jgi:nucleotide-binding universal stress UspA family protein
MAYKTVLATIGVDSPDSFIKSLAEVCFEAGSHLSVLVVALAAPPPIGDYAAMISDAWAEEREEDNQKLSAKINKIREALLNPNGLVSVEGLYTEVAWAHREIGAHAMYADLVLIGDTEIIGSDLRKPAIDGALFEARSAVLLLAPCDIVPSSAFDPGTVLLAWDSSLDGAAATRKAVEMMKAADEVHVAMVDPQTDAQEQDEKPEADIVTYLARHGIDVIVDRIPSAGRTVADTLLQSASELSADMIVMGAYGHSRLKERIFGGVTQSMIDNTTVSLLLAR